MPDNEMTKPFNPLLEFQPIAPVTSWRYESVLDDDPEYCEICGEQMKKDGNGYVCFNPNCRNYSVRVTL